MRLRGKLGALRRCLSVAATGSVLLSATVVVSAGSARAAGSPSVTALPTGFGSIAVDGGHDHLFVSSPSSNTVTVLDFSGSILSTLSGVSGARSMAVYGGSLFVITSAGIDVFDTGTLSLTGTLASGQLVDPRPLVEAAGLLWTSSGACYGSSTELASVNPSSGKVTLWPMPANTSLSYCIGLAASPYNPNLLLAWDVGLSPATITELDVSGGSPTVVASGDPTDLESLQQLAFNSDGTTFVAAAGAPSNFDEFRLSDLSLDGTAYQQSGPPGYPNAVITTAGRGGVIAGSASTFSSAYAYGPRHVTPADAFPEDAVPYPSGVALSPDGTTIFDVVQTNAGATELLTSTILSSTTLQMSAPSALNDGQRATISATVSGPLAPSPTGTVTFTDNGMTVANVNMTGGSASWSTSWASAGTHDISATYSGDSFNTASSGSTHITVGDPTTTVLSVSPNPGIEGSPIELEATVSASAPITGYATFYELNNGMQTTLGSAPMSQGSSSYSATLSTAGNVELFATYSGDQYNLASTSNGVTEQLDPAPGASLSTTSLDFGEQRVGTFGDPQTFTLTNTGSQALDVSSIALEGGALLDYAGATTCNAPVDPGASCEIAAIFGPTKPGSRSATIVIDDNAPGGHQTVALTGIGTEGYYIATAGGKVSPEGDAQTLGDATGFGLNSPIISIATTPDGDGYWLLGGDGGIFTFGDAGFYGSTGSIRLNRPVVGMASTADGGGYWLVASDGGIFTFGDAGFYGSTGSIRLNRPVVGMASTADGGGYWLVASDGGIFTFGDAGFYGSTGSIRLNKPIVGMASTPDGRGYWLVASDGGIFTFGDAPYMGSVGGSGAGDIIGMAHTSPLLDPYRADHLTAASIGQAKLPLQPPP